MSDHQQQQQPQQSEAAPQAVEPVAMGEQCCNDPPLDPDHTHSSGEIIKLADTDVYVSKPADYPHINSKLLLFLTNGTGVKSINNQLQADYYAKEGGFVVVMPDLFEGDPAPSAGTTTTNKLEEDSSLLETFKYKAAEGVKMFMIDIWLARHTPEKTLPIVEKVLAATKVEFADAASQVFAIGYCFGGKYVLKLATETGEITAGAVAHGLMITPEDIQAVKKPLSLACVAGDQFFPDEVRDEGKEHWQKEGLEHEVKVYEKVPHGFAVHGSYQDAHIKAAQVEANDQMLAWLLKYKS